MEVKLEKDFTKNVKVCFEHSLTVNGYNYLLIFGKHINGGFIAVPNWNICTEASYYKGDIYENTERLIKQGLEQTTARAIAEHIDSYL